MANAQQPTRRTRHVDMNQFIILEWTEAERLKYVDCPGKFNVSDSLSKPTGCIKHYQHHNILMGRRRPKNSKNLHAYKTHLSSTYSYFQPCEPTRCGARPPSQGTNHQENKTYRTPTVRMLTNILFLESQSLESHCRRHIVGGTSLEVDSFKLAAKRGESCKVVEIFRWWYIHKIAPLSKDNWQASPAYILWIPVTPLGHKKARDTRHKGILSGPFLEGLKLGCCLISTTPNAVDLSTFAVPLKGSSNY